LQPLQFLIKQEMTPAYRPEIDGLRALAVCAVVLYHASFELFEFNLLKGGFLGVDIFFVISGYLIALILFRELQLGSFTLLGFYERRARRILPALFVVIAATTPFAAKYILPNALQEYAGSVLSSLSFVSNFWFLFEDSYAAEPSLLKPFLHSWSLSVEEQFYALFPIGLLLLWRFARPHILDLFVAALLLSLLLAELTSGRFTNATFYMLPTRGWELLCGGVLAKFEMDRGRANTTGLLSFALPPVGLLVVILSLSFFNDEMRHPSLVTAIPVVATMLIIWFAREGEWTTSLLSKRPIVGVGLVSYSFYLWHYPIFAIARIRHPSLSDFDKLQLIAVSLGLATATYFFVEKTTRSKAVVKSSVFLFAIVISAVGLLAVHINIYESDGWPSRLGPVRELFTGLEQSLNDSGGRPCRNRSGNYCIFRPESPRIVMTVGDSHARSLSFAAENWAEAQNHQYIPADMTGCLMLHGLVREHPSYRDRCLAATDSFREYIRTATPRIIIWNGRLPLWLHGTRFDNLLGGVEDGGNIIVSPLDTKVRLAGAVETAVIMALEEWLSYGHIVVIVYPVPEAGWDIPKKIKAGLDEFSPLDQWDAFSRMEVTTNLSTFRERTQSSYDVLDRVEDHPNLIRVYPESIFCDEERGKCFTHSDANIYYEDDHHLSVHGAKMVIERVAKAIGK
jgi:peptidoglycan/LPS O-acetylase OafA/YrhL